MVHVSRVPRICMESSAKIAQMKKLFLQSGVLGIVFGLSMVTAPAASAYSITNSQNLRQADQALFDTFNSHVNRERLALDENILPEIFADSLRWDGISSSIDVIFINEGAGHRNQLFFSLNKEESLEILFEDIASTQSILPESAGAIAWKESKIQEVGDAIAALELELENSTELTQEELDAKRVTLTQKQNELKWRTDSLTKEKTLGNDGVGSMLLGDGKSINDLSGDVSIDFFIKANGARNANGKIYGADPEANADGLQHVVARELKQGDDNWVLLGFEDLYGPHNSEGGHSDRDFNDVVIAVRGVVGQSVNQPEDVPEPTTILGFLVMGALGVVGSRRRQCSSAS